METVMTWRRTANTTDLSQYEAESPDGQTKYVIAGEGRTYGGGVRRSWKVYRQPYGTVARHLLGEPSRLAEAKSVAQQDAWR